MGQGPVFADYKNKLPGKAGKTLSCFLRRWEEAGGESPEEELPNGTLFLFCFFFLLVAIWGEGLPEATPRSEWVSTGRHFLAVSVPLVRAVTGFWSVCLAGV